MRKSNRGQLVWGVLLLLLGAFFLIDNLDLLPELSESAWAIFLTGAAVLLFLAWLLSGIENWALLFPAAGTAAGALAIWLEQGEASGTLIGALVMVIISIPFWVGVLVSRLPFLAIPGWILLAIGLILPLESRVGDGVFAALIMFAIALPFLAIYLVKRENWWALIPFFVMTAVGLVVILSDTWRGEYIGALIMFAIATPFLVIYLSNRKNWWALIPAYVMSVIGVVILLATGARGETIGAVIMFAIGLPFLGVYLLNREYWWALIPAYAMSVIGVVILLSSAVRGEYIGALMMFAIGLPFLGVYLLKRENWWALIPGGIMLVIGLIILLATAGASDDLTERLIGGLIFGGLSLLFFLLWFGRRQETPWALIPAIGLAAAALVMFVFGPSVQIVWGVAIILAGVWLLYQSSRATPPKA